VPLGLGLSWLLGRAVGQFLGVALPPPRPGAGALLLAAALGPGVALAATWWPARRAARRDPLPELLGHAADGDGLPRWAAPVSVLLLAAGGAAEVGLLRGWCGPAAGRALLAPAFALLLTGCVLTLPLALPALLALCGALGRLFGVEGRLAFLQLRRRRSRTALTAGVLFVAVAVALAFGHALQATLDDLSRWYRRTITADFLVRGSQPDTAFLLAAAVPESLGEEIAGVDGVAEVDKLAFVPGRAAGRSVMVLARTFGAGPLPLDPREGTADAVADGLRRSEVVLGTVLADELGLHAGDTLELETRDGPRPLRVAGTAAEYAAGGRALYLEWEAARRLLPIEGPHCFLVRARPGAAAALAAPLWRFCDERGLLLQSNDSLRELIDRLLAGVRGALWGLAALGFVVAGLGIANTMTMSVLEQARELAVLRAIGMRRRQVGRLVLAQALLTGVAGLLPGTAVGVGLAYLLNCSTARLLGSESHFRVSPGLVAGCAAMALTTAALASLLPATRAARGRVV
jgi:putative ABC transport system permease protein